jgi:ElaB/YqjD/DUF883 family membrane-anchored ribosome-binding protein
MELSTFSENIVTETFERSGEKVTLKINLDALVPDYDDVLQERLAPSIQQLDELARKHAALVDEIEKLNKEQEKKTKKPREVIDLAPYMARLSEIKKGSAEVKREIFAERLTCPITLPDGSTTCILKGWDITENGMEIAASKANLLRMPTAAVEALFDFITSRLDPVKKRVDEEIEETSESTPSGSREHLALAPTG